MRIGSITFYEASLAGIQQQQVGIARLAQQIATGKNLLQPADDPVAASKALALSEGIAQRSQQLENQVKAENVLKLENVVLGEIRQSLVDARKLVIGLSPSLSPEIREQMANQLKASFEHLLSLANSQDSEGNYLFAGHDTRTQPYVTVTPVGTGPNYTEVAAYQGDAGTLNVAIEPGRTLQVSDPGPTVFGAEPTNVFEALYNIKQALDVAGSDPETDPNFAGDVNDAFALTQADIDAALAELDGALRRAAVVESRVGGALVELDAAKKTTQALLNQDLGALGRLEEVDQAAAIIELQRRQTTLEAAQRTYAQISGTNLFDFL